MNLDIELLKKEIKTIKQDISFLKDYITSKDSRKYFKIHFIYTDDKDFKAEPFILDFSSKLSLSHASLYFVSKQDTTYYTKLMPELNIFHNEVYLFIITKEPILPILLDTHISLFPGKTTYSSYLDSDDFYKETSKYSLESYKVYNNTTTI